MSMTRKIMLLTIALMFLTGCSANKNIWESDNQVRIFLNLKLDSLNGETENNFFNQKDLKLDDAFASQIKKLKKAMIDYFSEEYAVDITDKLDQQQLRSFESNYGTYGYVNPDEPQYLYLNVDLFDADADLFNNTYVHESLHQIGFRAHNCYSIDEGITDALTDLVLIKAGIGSFPTPIYADARTLGYQILEADKDIVNFYLDSDNPDITERISETLKDVNMPFLKRNDTGEMLEVLLDNLTYETISNIDPYYMALQAQEIVRAYCQTFQPTTEEISSIRKMYLVEDYENVTIKQDGDMFIIQ